MSVKHRRLRRGRLILAVGVSALVRPVPGLAGTDNWGAASGLWSVPGNWAAGSANAPPAAGDSVTLNFGGGNATSTDDLAAGITLNSLDVSQDSLGAAGLIQNTPLTANNIYVGNLASGAYVQNAATTVNSSLYIGYTTNGASASFVENTSLQAGTEFIGYNGTGIASLNQTAATSTSTNTASIAIYVGYGSQGTYQMAGNVHTPLEVIGDYATGTLTQSAGTTTIYDLQVGASASGTYTMNSPNGMNVNQIELGALTNGSGMFIQQRAQVVVIPGMGFPGDVNIGETAGTCAGQYVIQGGEVEAEDINVGLNSTGGFDHSGNSEVAVSGSINVGVNSTGAGTYNLHGSGVIFANFLKIGVSGSGTMLQNGADTGIYLQDALEMGINAGSSGSYKLDGGFIVAPSEIIGSDGTAVFTQGQASAATNSDSGSLFVGNACTYNLYKGLLSVSGNAILLDGLSSTAKTSFFQWTASASVTVGGTLQIGIAGTGNVSYFMGGGTLTAGNVTIDAGTLTQLSGSTTIPGTLTVSNGGLYKILFGSLSSTVSNLVTPSDKLQINGGNVNLIVLDGSGVMQVNAGGTVQFGTPASANAISGVDVENSGTITLSNGSDIALGGSALIHNISGSIFNLAIDAGLSGSNATFQNDTGAILEKSAGTGTSTIASGVTFTNSGTVDGQSGTLDLACGGTNSGALKSESLATVKLGGSWTLNNGTVFNGSGVTVAYGDLTLMANASASTDFQLTGMLQGTGYTFTSSNLFELLGGTISSPSGTTPMVVDAQNINVSGGGYLDNATLTNEVSAYHSGGDLQLYNNATILNNGTWNIADDSSILGDGTATFNNSGSLIKTGGTGTSVITVAINNTNFVGAESGTMDMQVGGSSTGTGGEVCHVTD